MNNFGLSVRNQQVTNGTDSDTPGVQVKFYAHTAELPDGSRDPDESHWQPLAVHLRNVAKLAKRFAGRLDLSAQAELAGLLHDL